MSEIKNTIKVKVRIVLDAEYDIMPEFYEVEGRDEVIAFECNYVHDNPAFMVDLIQDKGTFSTSVEEV